MRKILVAVAAVMMALVPIGFVSGVADAQPNHNRPCENWPVDHPVFDAHPLCIDGVFTPPGHTDDPACNNPGRNPNCENGEEPPPPPPPDPAECPPGTGPVSGVVQQISDGIRGGGGAPLADVIDTVNCEIIVGVLGL